MSRGSPVISASAQLEKLPNQKRGRVEHLLLGARVQGKLFCELSMIMVAFLLRRGT